MDELYRTDLALWSAQQAAAIRAAAREGSNAPVDWDNVAEEIASLGASERRTLASHITTVIEHLMKLQASPARDPRRSWRETVARARGDIETILTDSPSLRREVSAIVMRQTESARGVVRIALEEWDEHSAELDDLSYDADQVLGDWFPGSEA
ncbi:MAG: DUF29 domain-containing protein [Acetobacteraceae bacterium]